ncbi:kinesin-like protein KIF20B [Syngnathoides biaculeatus]|uniref:kinesin-like protein KIF20B n=1 Tax=Syngnathoides biaculeatus TaxID=300417 RepID=UPI002ADE7F36|nr:kinesin-like protein KIF20B [Syngnathoides biaculeatus]
MMGSTLDTSYINIWVTESCQMDQDGMEDVNALRSEGSSSSSLRDSRLTQVGNSEERAHLKVYLRVRPFTAAEAQNGESQDLVSAEPPDGVVLRPPGSDGGDRSFLRTAQRFRFSQVYGPDTTQSEFFRGTVKDLVADVLRGGNSLVFTYGVTNAGKTFTFLGPDGDVGVLPRSLHAIFDSVEGKVWTGPSVKPQRRREFVWLSEEQRAEEAAFKGELLRQVNDVTAAGRRLPRRTSSLGEAHVLPSAFQCETAKSGTWSSGERTLLEGKFALRLETDVRFSVWVSFCEIYNENIHDLLEASPGGPAKRTALRLSQDAKGGAFVKDLRWVQVGSADEAYRVMKLGKKNQSFSSTRINHLSSRSHSIFSVRILRIAESGSPRAVAVSELCLCDLAGSERGAKTANRGERLKEAGNINASLLTLGKCINALKRNQHAKLPQHVAFRESKLTHYLQAFFCGPAQVRMLVNVSRCASAYDETLRVLRFSAVAQKVALAPGGARPLPPQKSTRPSGGGGQTGQGELQEDDGEEEETMSMEDTVYQNEEDENIFRNMTPQQVALLRSLRMASKEERAAGSLAEARLREDIGREFEDILAEMQMDFEERLARERELLERRAEERLEIFKKMTDKMAACRDAREEAPGSLREERAAREDVIAAPERKGRETEKAPQEPSKSQEDSRVALDAEERSVAEALDRERSLEKEVGRLLQEVRTLTAALEASQRKEASDERPEESREREAWRDPLRQNLERPETGLRAAGSSRASAAEDRRGVQTHELHRSQQEAAPARSAASPPERRPGERHDDDDDGGGERALRREAERRRELLAVAHEAIEQKDAELEKRALQIAKLKEVAKQDSDKVKSLSADLERKEEDSSELREKLADYKKQIQRVHKDISAMKDEEKLLRRKLSDAEKLKNRLQSDLTDRDRTIRQLKAEKKPDETQELYRRARQDLEAERRLVDDMRSALAEQDETQEQMERALDQKVELVRELSDELDKMKAALRQPGGGGGGGGGPAPPRSLEPLEEKHRTERDKWREDKMALIAQLKEAEDKRNQEMKKFAEDRERYLARQARLENDLRLQEEKMASWRTERDALVGALELQLAELVAGRPDRDRAAPPPRRDSSRSPAEVSANTAKGGGDEATPREAHVTSAEGDTEDADDREPETRVQVTDAGGAQPGDPSPSAVGQVTSMDSSGCPSVLESSRVSGENGRGDRFPRPELEISFSPLRPDRVAVRRRGVPGASAVTVKITRSARKRRSGEMDEGSGPSASPGTAGVRGPREGTLQKIGEFLQSSPTLIGCKAKKMMSLMSGADSNGSSSVGLKSKKSKRKLASADEPPRTTLGRDVVAGDNRSRHPIIKGRLRSGLAR